MLKYSVYKFFVFSAFSLIFWGLAACSDDCSTSTDEDALVLSSDDSEDVKAMSSSSRKANSNGAEQSGSSKAKPDSSDEKNSEKIKSSSSDVIQSSSSEVPETSSSNADSISSSSEASCKYGELVDDRDGHVYKVVQIGNQVWMAENLDYAYPGGTAESPCSGNKCEKYGLRYAWSAAMDSAAMFSEGGGGCGLGGMCKPEGTVRGVCPAGWHLPSLKEFEVLINEIDPYFGYGHTTYSISRRSGKYLKSKDGWTHAYNGTIFGGVDSYGFSVIPTGFYDKTDWEYARFWSSSEYSDNVAFGLLLSYTSDGVILDTIRESEQRSVRCIMDSDISATPSESPGKVRISGTLIKGEMVDSRDSHVYKTVQIGNKVWMAENLNYNYTQKTNGRDSSCYCYNDLPSYCNRYGRLYLWSAVMDSAARFSEEGKDCGNGVKCSVNGNVRGPCPRGWHIPSRQDFDDLIAASDPEHAHKYTDSDYIEDGSFFLSTMTPHGIDDFGLSLLYAGFESDFPIYDGLGERTSLWSSSESDEISAACFFVANGIVSLGSCDKDVGWSVRCVQD